MAREDKFPPFELPCGNTAYFDHQSGISYRCSGCFAVVGSMGMPSHCSTLLEEEYKRKQVLKVMSAE